MAGDRAIAFPRVVCTGVDQKLAYDAIASRLLGRLQEGYSVTLRLLAKQAAARHTPFSVRLAHYPKWHWRRPSMYALPGVYSQER